LELVSDECADGVGPPDDLAPVAEFLIASLAKRVLAASQRLMIEHVPDFMNECQLRTSGDPARGWPWFAAMQTCTWSLARRHERQLHDNPRQSTHSMDAITHRPHA
jgi:hypothetical protein